MAGQGEAVRHGTRDRILVAAATMLGEDPTTRLSVRAVAARAGVSTGSLRHFFPTQRELVDTVVARLYDVEVPDDPIHDTTLPPAERLLACLQQAVSAFGPGTRTQQVWRATHEAYASGGFTHDQTATLLALERLGVHRITRWLTVLGEEGALPAGDDEQRARFLGTLLTGILAERILPTDASRLAAEEATLRLAVRAVMGDAPVGAVGRGGAPEAGGAASAE